MKFINLFIQNRNQMCKFSSKLFVIFVGCILWALSAILIWIGIAVLHDYRHMENIGRDFYISAPSICLFVCAALFFLIGIMGCLGSIKENKCLLGTFCTFIVIITVILIISGGLAYHFRDDVKSNAEKTLMKALNHYDYNDTIWEREVDFIQQNFHCCGIHNFTDWKGTPWSHNHKNETVPSSCCKANECDEIESVFDVGCVSKIEEFVTKHLNDILGTAAGFLALMILSVLASCVLLSYRKSRENVPYVGLIPEGSRRA